MKIRGQLKSVYQCYFSKSENWTLVCGEISSRNLCIVTYRGRRMHREHSCWTDGAATPLWPVSLV